LYVFPWVSPPFGQSRRLRGDSFLLLGLLLQAVQIIGCTLRMSGGAENRAFVLFQDLEPALNIGGMLFAGLRRKFKIGTKKGRAKFSNQLFACVAFITPFLAPKFTVKALLCFVQCALCRHRHKTHNAALWIMPR